MIQIKLPDGSIGQFPDGMSDADIEAVLQREFGGGNSAAPASMESRFAQATAAVPTNEALSSAVEVRANQQRPGNFLDPLAQGVSFGFADEGAGAISGLGSLIRGEGFQAGFNEEVKKRRADLEGYRKKHPVKSTALEIGGAALPALLTRGASAEATLAARVFQGLKSGAIFGGLYGAGTAEGGVPERAQGAATGAAFGAGAGVAAPVAGRVISLAATPLKNAASAIRGAVTPETEALRRVGGALRRDQVNPNTAAQTLTAAQPGTLAVGDVGGETTRALARSSANTSPEAREGLQALVNNRQESQRGRFVDFVRGIAPTNAPNTQEGLQTAARRANKPAYDRAYAAGNKSIISPELERLTGSPDVVAAMADAATKGKSRAIADGFGAFNPGVTVTKDGQVLFGRGKAGTPTYPNLQFWDYTYRSLRDAGDAAFRAGRNSEGQYLATLARQMRGELDRIVPEFGQARGKAAAFFGAEDALEAGAKFATSRMDNAAAAKAVLSMSRPERRLFEEGYATQLVNRVMESGDRRSIINDLFLTSGASRDRTRIALGPQRAQQIEAFLRVENTMDLLKRAVQGNSTTARQLAELGLAGGAGAIASGGNVTDPKFILTALMVRGGRMGLAKVDERVALRVGEMLASNDPQIVQKAYASIAGNQQLAKLIRVLEAAAAREVAPLAENIGGTVPAAANQNQQ